MDLNGNSDYKLHGRAGWVEYFQWIVRDSGVWRISMSPRARVWTLNFPLFPTVLTCVYMCSCVYRYLGRYMCE